MRTKTELIIALDLANAKEASKLLDRLPESIRWFKVGLELFIGDGPAVIDMLKSRGKQIFLDLKLHDIPNTVASAVSSSARLGISMLTVHASGGNAMMQAAANAARQAGKEAPKLIAVTTLTSLNEIDMAQIGIKRSLNEHVLALAKMALASEMNGLVSSVHEVPLLRKHFGASPIIVTPGIRPEFAQTAVDQKRVSTPKTAVEAGSDFLVVGRPILTAQDPRAAAIAILKEMDIAKPINN